MRPSWWYAALFLLASAGPRGLKHDWTRVDRFTLGGQLCCGQFLYAVKLPSGSLRAWLMETREIRCLFGGRFWRLLMHGSLRNSGLKE